MTKKPPSVKLPVMGIYWNAEERVGLITMHESWSIDDGLACYGSFATREEAEAAAVRKGYRPAVIRNKPLQNDPSKEA